MRVLEIYPNSRSLRVAQKSYLKENRLSQITKIGGRFWRKGRPLINCLGLGKEGLVRN